MKASIVQPLTEREFTRMVLELAKLRGWRSAHFRPARTVKGWRTAVQGDGAGWPDLFCLRRAELLAAELKVGNGRLSPQQNGWLAALRAAGVPCFVWYPRDWAVIEAVLENGPQGVQVRACSTPGQ
jgi:hypothetical protein